MTKKTAATPAAMGYRMPAEWEPHAATWLSWPRREGISFPDAYDRVMPTFQEMVAALLTSEGWRRWLQTRATLHAHTAIISGAGVADDC